MSLSQDVGGAGEGARFVDLLEGDQELPEVHLLETEQANQVREAVDALPTHLREILLLSYFQQMSYVQISESLQIPLGTVKSRLHSAVAAFSNSWKTTKTLEQE
jgi:RNA polymerase sigma-70 factor (ECF subfamily)